MVHGVSPLLIEILAGINQQDTPPPLSLHTPEMTISPHYCSYPYSIPIAHIILNVIVFRWPDTTRGPLFGAAYSRWPAWIIQSVLDQNIDRQPKKIPPEGGISIHIDDHALARSSGPIWPISATFLSASSQRVNLCRSGWCARATRKAPPTSR